MEAGWLPANSQLPRTIPSPTTEGATDNIKFEEYCFIFQKICKQCCTLSILEQATYNKQEKSILYKALTTTLLQVQTLLSLSHITKLHYNHNPNATTTQSPPIKLFDNCKFFCSKLWLQLKHPAATNIMNILIHFIITLDSFLTQFVIPHLQIEVLPKYTKFLPSEQ
jgi:hypothetical protein